MKKSLSLRWRLILFSASLALLIALALMVVLHLRTRRQLLQQLVQTLEWKCDEVITVLESADLHASLDEFLHVETNYRVSPNVYFYQIRNAQGHTLVKSQNLGEHDLPLPEAWKAGDVSSRVYIGKVVHPVPARVERILLRSELFAPALAGGGQTELVIQTAVSLGSYESTVRQTLVYALLVAFGGLTGVFFLLWFVTTRSLRPVSSMTRKASKITAMNLRERLPLTGRGDEVDELASVLNDMLDRLAGSLQQMEQFASGAAHELRTPLTRIRGELELILRGDVAELPRSQLERIQEEVERLSRLCGRLLLLARLDRQAADASLLAERVDLEELVSELLEQMRPLAQDHGVELRQGATAAVHVRGSRPLLVQALLNLLANAIRYTPEGLTVVVSIEANADQTRVSVEDGGPGIPPEEREGIFQPFHRIPRPSTEPDDGTGLGLAIVKAIARAHGGCVELADAPRRGSVFRLVFPTDRGV